MMSDDLRRIRFITQHYSVLQGLRTIPLGLWFFVSAMSDGGWWPWFQIWRPISHGLSLVLVVALYWLIGLYYRRTYGQVQHPAQEKQEKRKGIIMAALLLAALIIDWQLRPPLNLLALAVGLTFLGYYLSQASRYRPYFVLLALVFIALAFLPWLLGTTVEDPLWGSGGVAFQLALGVSLIAAGLFDHFFLASILQPLPEEHDGKIV
jgi:hypothetical protein